MEQLCEGDLDSADVIALLSAHLDDMIATSPPESRHALPLDGLRAPDVTFWALRGGGGDLLGVAALQQIAADHGEIKSMRTADAHRRTGVAARLLAHLIAEGRRRGYRRLSLETGSMAFFAPARALYARTGFVACPPFGSYRLDPNSVFMTLDLATAGTDVAGHG